VSSTTRMTCLVTAAWSASPTTVCSPPRLRRPLVAPSRVLRRVRHPRCLGAACALPWAMQHACRRTATGPGYAGRSVRRHRPPRCGTRRAARAEVVRAVAARARSSRPGAVAGHPDRSCPAATAAPDRLPLRHRHAGGGRRVAGERQRAGLLAEGELPGSGRQHGTVGSHRAVVSPTKARECASPPSGRATAEQGVVNPGLKWQHFSNAPWHGVQTIEPGSSARPPTGPGPNRGRALIVAQRKSCARNAGVVPARFGPLSGLGMLLASTWA
jgi:hypothetical protein